MTPTPSANERQPQSSASGIEAMKLADIVDVPALQSLMDDFHTLTEIPVALLDLQGAVLVGAGWQRVCTAFHRRHPETSRHCTESDTRLSAGIAEGEFRLYKCMNGLWDAATPVTVGGRPLGNLFTGQFFLDDDPAQDAHFRAQAARYGFPQEEYMAAVEAVPRISRAKVESAMSFMTKLATMVSQLSFGNVELSRMLSERETLVRSLEKSRERLASAQQIAHLGSWELDLARDELTWSDEVYRIFGLEPQQFAATYEAFLEAVHPDDRAAVNDAYSRSLREGKDCYEIEHRVVRGSGEIRYVHEKCEHFRNASGEIIRSVGMVHDITERRAAEAALRESDLSYRQILDSIPGMVFTMRPDGYCDYLGAQWAEFTGVARDALLGNGRYDSLHPDDRPRALAAWREAARQCVPYDLEYRIRRHDDDYEWFKVRVRPIRNEAGGIARWIGTALNIDQLVRTQEELRRAKADAEAATRAKSEFLANMSHEIRTPMNAIIGMTELTLDTPLSRQQRDYLEMVQSSAESLLKVINDILDFSKIEAGLMEFDSAPIDLRDIVEKTVHTLALRAHQKGIELACRIDPAVPPAVLGDGGRLRQVLINLIGNAIKFTEAGEIVLCVAVSATGEEDRCALRFSVSDTGIGIPADKMDILFGYFSQVDGSAARRFEGTGLGLAISQQIVEKMGGRIEVESVAGEGSTFSFSVSFPLPARLIKQAQHPQSDLEGMRVLIVDDNETNRRILTEMVTNWGMTATTASDGPQGIEQLRTAAAKGAPFRLLLLDERMPGMDGFAVAEAIRSDATLPELNIMMLSSGDVPAAVERCRQVGITTYLIKPLRQSELFDTLMETFCYPPFREAQQTQAPPQNDSATGAARILLAEDNRINRTLAKTLLEKRGWTVLTAGNGEEAMEVWRREQIDLILMDVQMPEVDGLQATRRIRQEEKETQRRRVPIIGLTAHAMKGDKEVCLEAGMDDYVPKPVRAEVLYGAVERGLFAEEGGSVIDLSYVLDTVDGDRALVAELVRQFIRDYPPSCGELREALNAGDFAKAERNAHSLKSVVGIFGAEKAQDLLTRLEDAAGGRDARGMQALLQPVLAEIEKVGRCLAALAEEGATPKAQSGG